MSAAGRVAGQRGPRRFAVCVRRTVVPASFAGWGGKATGQEVLFRARGVESLVNEGRDGLQFAYGVQLFFPASFAGWGGKATGQEVLFRETSKGRRVAGQRGPRRFAVCVSDVDGGGQRIWVWADFISCALQQVLDCLEARKQQQQQAPRVLLGSRTVRGP